MNIKIKNRMPRILATIMAVLLLVSFTPGVAYAGKVHFNKSNPPTFTSSGLTLTASGTVFGLGYGDVLVVLNASGNANMLCTNPGGSSKVPGQNPNFSAKGSGSFPASEVKNGHLSFTVTTDPPQSPIPGAPDCPNSGWTETITSITWTSAEIIIYQFDVVVLDQTFYF